MHHELSVYIWILPIISVKIYTIGFADPETVIVARHLLPEKTSKVPLTKGLSMLILSLSNLKTLTLKFPKTTIISSLIYSHQKWKDFLILLMYFSLLTNNLNYDVLNDNLVLLD